jgi:hypothetical protein
VQHTGGVRHLERAEQRDADLRHGARGECAVLHDDLGQAARLEQLHHDPGPAGLGDHVVDLYDRRVRQCRRGARLAQCPLVHRGLVAGRHPGGE